MLSKCRSCDSSEVAVVATREKFPLYIWPLQKDDLTKLEDIDLYVCNNCGYMQLQHMSNSTISQIYRNEAFNIDNPSQIESRYQLICQSKNKFSDKRVLEVGGGRNSFITSLPDETEKWIADFSIDEQIKPDLDGYFIGDFNEIKFENNKFDFVFMFHVLEHFNNPGIALSKARTLLKTSGRLIVEVPNFEFECQKIPYYTLFHMHISLFTENSLISFMKRFGFKCIDFFKKNNVLLAEFSMEESTNDECHKNHSIDLIHKLEFNINNSRAKIIRMFQDIKMEKIAIFGAGGATTLFLYNFPFLIKKLCFAIDNNSKKWGRYLCNGEISIISSKDFLKKDVNNVIILDESHIKLFNTNKINLINIGNFYDS